MASFATPPFPVNIHLKCPDETEEITEKINAFRDMLKSTQHYQDLESWLTVKQLHRFLIARNYDVKKSFELMQDAMKWRMTRTPHLIESQEGWESRMSKESETGKIYCPALDQYGRPVLVFDNTVQNTKSVDDQMTFLAWNLEFAIRQMPSHVDKYVVFMHLGNFSFFNCPPLQSTRETIHMLCNCFPERLGHCIAYQPPGIFKTFFNTVKGFIDPKTASKVVFVTGDVDDGSENDLKMREIIGDNWKTLTGAGQPVYAPNTSPGYRHDVYWPTVMDRITILNALESKERNNENCDDGSNI